MILSTSLFISKLLFWEAKYLMGSLFNVFSSKTRTGWDKGFYAETSIQWHTYKFVTAWLHIFQDVLIVNLSKRNKSKTKTKQRRHKNKKNYFDIRSLENTIAVPLQHPIQTIPKINNHTQIELVEGLQCMSTSKWILDFICTMPWR